MSMEGLQMLNYIWGGMILLSIVFGAFNGKLPEVASAVMKGATEGVNMSLSLLGIMCLWTGIMEIANKSGFTKFFSYLLRPITKLIFPHVPQNSEAMNAIVMNMTANMFGMSNAATPLGIKAVKELHKLNPSKIASDEICMFVVINTASLELVPSTVLALRQSVNSQNPFEIIVPVWIASILSITVGVILAKIFSKGERKVA